MGTLSSVLLEKNWFCALGTTEYHGTIRDGVLVRRGKAHTYDTNNGVLAVYDEQGRPWIPLDGSHVRPLNVEFPHHHHLLRAGAHVPHSNDGGRFVLVTLPALFGVCSTCGSTMQHSRFCSECGSDIRV